MARVSGKGKGKEAKQMNNRLAEKPFLRKRLNFSFSREKWWYMLLNQNRAAQEDTREDTGAEIEMIITGLSHREKVDIILEYHGDTYIHSSKQPMNV